MPEIQMHFADKPAEQANKEHSVANLMNKLLRHEGMANEVTEARPPHADGSNTKSVRIQCDSDSEKHTDAIRDCINTKMIYGE